MKMGIIGFGGMASYHVSELKHYKRVEVAGIFDLSPERMAYARSIGLSTYDSKERMLLDDTIDFILIATTNEVHKELAIEVMEAGKHVLCEKPVTLTSGELEEIMEAEKRTGKLFTINHNRRSNKDFVLMKKKVEENLLGDVYIIESRVEGSRGMPKGWRTIKSLGGGMMLDWGVHLIDQLLFMKKEKVLQVSCQMYFIEYDEVDDNFRLNLTFEDGVVAQIEVSTNNYITHPRWYVLGKEGTLEINDWSCDGKIVRCIDKDSVWEDEIVYTKAGPTKVMAPRREESTESIVLSEPQSVIDHISLVYDQLIDAIEGKKTLTITSQEAMRVMKVMEAAFEAHDQKQIVKTMI